MNTRSLDILKSTLVFVFLFAANELQGQLPLSNDLVAFYPLDGNAQDASGQGNHATSSTITFGENRFGVPNSAGLFAGSSTSIVKIDSEALNIDSDFSISVG